MKRVKIVGAGGYGGVGITELLLRHPEMSIDCLTDVQEMGLRMSDLYPHLEGFCDQRICAPDDPKATEPYDAVFFATPDRVSMHHAAAELEKGACVVDFSGDFRFSSSEQYGEYARKAGLDPVHSAPDLLSRTVYALPELHAIGPEQRLGGNPGCFAVSCILGLAPAAAKRLFYPDRVICDCKTAVSGAGKKPSPTFHYPARHDQINAYKLAGHQHVVEIEQELGRLAGEAMSITMTTQVLPLCRGILSCLYADLTEVVKAAELLEIYRDFYAASGFVRIYDRTATIGTAQVRGTNFCNLIVDVDERNNRLRVISHIDNLMKGQAGNALQAMNRMLGFAPDCGLDFPSRCP